MSRILIATPKDIDFLAGEWFKDIALSRCRLPNGGIDICFARMREILFQTDIKTNTVFYLGVQEHVNFAPIRREINSLLKNVEITEYDFTYIKITHETTQWSTKISSELTDEPTEWRSIIFKIKISPHYNASGKAVLLKLLGVLLRSTTPLEAWYFHKEVLHIMKPPPISLAEFLRQYYENPTLCTQTHNISKQNISVSQIQIIDDVSIMNRISSTSYAYRYQSDLWILIQKEKNLCLVC